MNISTVASPHVHEGISVPRIMGAVMLALTPATAFGLYQFGWPAINLFLVTLAAALLAEAACLAVARQPVGPFIGDGSALLTGWLLAVSLPPWAPWWTGALGSVFAVVVGKHVFGGIGRNLFNPAMLGRVALLVSFPLELTTWLAPRPLGGTDAPGFLEGLGITFSGIPNVDTVSSASLLGHVKTEFTRGHGLTEALSGHYDPLASTLGLTAGSLGETSALLLLLGGLWLIWKRIIGWQVPVAMLGTVALLATVMHFIGPERYAPAAVHLLSGGLMLGALFIATDPVTSPGSPRGQLLFGAGCGLLVYVIRTWGAYPEGLAFAVLIMNAAAPLIDHYLRPRIYGRGRDGKPLQPVKAKQP